MASAHRVAKTSREQLLQQLSSPPLELRAGFLFAQFIAPIVLQVCCLGIGVLMLWVSVREFRALRAEPARWARAIEIGTFGPPVIRLERRLLMTPVFPDVHVTWRSSTPPHAPASVKYDVLWYVGAALEPPYVVKQDALGTLTNVGLALTLQREGSLLLFFVFGVGLLLGCAYYAQRLAGRQRDFRAVAASPRAMFRPLVKTEALRQKGIATGQIAYTFLALSGESVQQVLSKPRAPVFDLDETSVLVVTAFDAPDAEPILVADDGYPFAPRF